MTAFNIVRFRVKQGHEEQFIAAHRRINPGFKGFRGGALVKPASKPFVLLASGRALRNSPMRARR